MIQKSKKQSLKNGSKRKQHSRFQKGESGEYNFLDIFFSSGSINKYLVSFFDCFKNKSLRNLLEKIIFNELEKCFRKHYRQQQWWQTSFDNGHQELIFFPKPLSIDDDDDDQK